MDSLGASQLMPHELQGLIEAELLVTVVKLHQLQGLLAAICLEAQDFQSLIAILYQAEMTLLCTAMTGRLDDDPVRREIQGGCGFSP